MLPDRVSKPGPLTYESGALPIALRGPASNSLEAVFLAIFFMNLCCRIWINHVFFSCIKFCQVWIWRTLIQCKNEMFGRYYHMEIQGHIRL